MRLIKTGRARAAKLSADGLLLAIALLDHVVTEEEKKRRNALINEMLRKQRTGLEYDRIDRDMTIRECAELPMAGDLSKTQHKPAPSAAEWAYRVNRSRFHQPHTAEQVRAIRLGAV